MGWGALLLRVFALANMLAYLLFCALCVPAAPSKSSSPSGRILHRRDRHRRSGGLANEGLATLGATRSAALHLSLDACPEPAAVGALRR